MFFAQAVKTQVYPNSPKAQILLALLIVTLRGLR
jgi:hypothetical protein